MYVYIDESGIFSNPANRQNIASCVSALVIPGSQQDEIFVKFQQLLSSWPAPAIGREIKGSKLNEEQIAGVVSLLRPYEVVLDTIGIDLGLHTEEEITDFRTRQANNLIANLTSEHHPNLIRQAHRQRDYLLRMKNPLFVQAFLLWLLIPRLFEKVTLYYSRRIPEELGEFHWIIDAKDKRITEFEESWSTLIRPTVSNYGLEHPLTMVEGGDYSYLDRYLETDEQLLANVRQEHGPGDEELDVLSFSKVFGESLVFGNSNGKLGLQLVDILVNATQRALNGKLRKPGWEAIGTLMLAQRHGTVRFISFNTDAGPSTPRFIRSHFSAVAESLNRVAKPIL